MNKRVVAIGAAIWCLPHFAFALTSLHLGNSLTAQAFYILEYYAAQKGKDLDANNASSGGQFRAGFGLGLYGAPSLSGSGDQIYIQTYKNGSLLGIDQETGLVGDWYRALLNTNQNAVCYVYSPYPVYHSTQDAWEQEWFDAEPLDGPGYAQNYNAKIFHETLRNNVAANFPQKRVYLMPLGHILHEAVKLIGRGEYPGCTSIKDLYSSLSQGVPDPNLPIHEGEVHLGPLGIYIQVATQYALSFNDRPHGGPISNLQMPNSSAKFSVPEDFARKTWDLVWDCLVANTTMTGVTGATSVCEGFLLVPIKTGIVAQVALPPAACMLNGRGVNAAKRLALTSLVVRNQAAATGTIRLIQK